MANEMRLIDANALKTKVFNLALYVSGLRFGKTAINSILESYRKGVFGEIDNAPTVDAKPVVHGRWIRCLDEYDCEFIECPLCGEQFCDGDNDTFDKPYNYCPNCGAKMDGDGNA